MQSEPANRAADNAKQIPAAKGEGERVDKPGPDEGGAIRGAREDLDIAHEVAEEAKESGEG